MAGVSGDFRALDELIRKLGDLGPKARAECASVLAEEVRELVLDGFEKGRAPDGTPWTPLSPRTVARRRKGSSLPLRDTGRLRNSITVAHDANGVYVTTNVVYAATHNFGLGAIPARPFLPPGELPGPWRAALDEAARDIVETLLK